MAKPKLQHWQPPAEFLFLEQRWRTVFSDDMGDADGTLLGPKALILLDSRNNPEVHGVTWLHELIHLAWSEAGLRDLESVAPHEEQIVTALASHIWATLRRNKLRFD